MTIEPYTFQTLDGREHAAELGRLWVPENHARPSGSLIRLAFVRLRSTAAQPGPPIVFLAGGPGIPGSGMGRVPVYFRQFERLRAVADVILLDQRGTGLSTPNLEWSDDRALPADMLATAEKALSGRLRQIRACAAHWRRRGVDLAAYNTNASADDLESLRKALGAERLSLLGFSYGTELALAAIRRHGERLHRVVLAGTRGPDHVLHLPGDQDLQLRKLSHLAAQDPSLRETVPDLTALLKQVLAGLETKPVTVSVTDQRSGQPVTLTMGKFGLQAWLQGAISDGRAFPMLPALLHSLQQGDHTLLSRVMERFYNGLGSVSAMGIAVNCASGWSPERQARVRREARVSLLGDAPDFSLRESRRLLDLPDLGPAFRSRIWSTVPTLFVTGSLDGVTPPSQAEEVRLGFPNSAHVVVENAAHETLPVEEVQALVSDFLAGRDVKSRAVSLPPPRFLSVEEAKAH